MKPGLPFLRLGLEALQLLVVHFVFRDPGHGPLEPGPGGLRVFQLCVSQGEEQEVSRLSAKVLGLP